MIDGFGWAGDLGVCVVELLGWNLRLWVVICCVSKIDGLGWSLRLWVVF